MALYYKSDVKNDFAYVLQFFLLISDSLGSVYCEEEMWAFGFSNHICQKSCQITSQRHYANMHYSQNEAKDSTKLLHAGIRTRGLDFTKLRQPPKPYSKGEGEDYAHHRPVNLPPLFLKIQGHCYSRREEAAWSLLILNKNDPVFSACFLQKAGCPIFKITRGRMFESRSRAYIRSDTMKPK